MAVKTSRIIKRFKNLTHSEELSLAQDLIDGANAVELIKRYIQQEIMKLDCKLNQTEKLYAQPSAHLMVAGLLAKRESLFKLLDLLVTQIKLDDDQSEHV